MHSYQCWLMKLDFVFSSFETSEEPPHSHISTTASLLQLLTLNLLYGFDQDSDIFASSCSLYCSFWHLAAMTLLSTGQDKTDASSSCHLMLIDCVEADALCFSILDEKLFSSDSNSSRRWKTMDVYCQGLSVIFSLKPPFQRLWSQAQRGKAGWSREVPLRKYSAESYFSSQKCLLITRLHHLW